MNSFSIKIDNTKIKKIEIGCLTKSMIESWAQSLKLIQSDDRLSNDEENKDTSKSPKPDRLSVSKQKISSTKYNNIKHKVVDSTEYLSKFVNKYISKSTTSTLKVTKKKSKPRKIISNNKNITLPSGRYTIGYKPISRKYEVQDIYQRSENQIVESNDIPFQVCSEQQEECKVELSDSLAYPKDNFINDIIANPHRLNSDFMISYQINEIQTRVADEPLEEFKMPPREFTSINNDIDIYAPNENVPQPEIHKELEPVCFDDNQEDLCQQEIKAPLPEQSPILNQENIEFISDENPVFNEHKKDNDNLQQIKLDSTETDNEAHSSICENADIKMQFNKTCHSNNLMKEPEDCDQKFNNIKVNSHKGLDTSKLTINNMDFNEGKSMIIDSYITLDNSNILDCIIQNTPNALRIIARHLFDKENLHQIDNTPYILCINEETDNLVVNEEFMSLYNKLLDIELLDSHSEDKLLNQLLKETKGTLDLSDYAAIKTNLVLNCSYEYAKYFLSKPTKHKLFDMNCCSVNVLQEYSDSDSIVYTICKSVKSLGFLSFSRTMTLLSKMIEFQSSSSNEGRICYIIEKSVPYSQSSSSALCLESNILVKITLITECNNQEDFLDSEFNRKCFIKEYYVINYNSILSTRSQKMNMATQERLEFYNFLRNYVTLHPEMRNSQYASQR